MTRTDTADAKTRLLDAAEHLFTEHGFAATSVRRIATAAGVPLAMVSYHFGSKKGLMEAVYARALGQRDTSRVGYLDRLEKQAGGAPISVDILVEAFISSALRLTHKGTISGAVFKQMIGRAFYEPEAGVEDFFPTEYAEAVERYKCAFMRALPALPVLSEADVVWRMYFFVGMVAYAMAGKDVMRMTEIYALEVAGRPEAMLRRLMPFIVAGFNAPSADLAPTAGVLAAALSA
ncbi:MAG TPA: TetR family transcriptional regulator [Denitromonas sp.]|nr:TetR family transcriptional regulator [Rhodocyclaceae bacterium]HPR07042.1 TetR family transcriptional regulator [Denitromonas sp.]HQV14819.1 TetR family transcriptional regulator [Denitromonas sp.]